MIMSDPSRTEIINVLIKSVEPSISRIVSNEIQNFSINSKDLKTLRSMENYNFELSKITSDNFSIVDYKNTFIWGKSTWGVDTVSRDRLIRSGEYNPITRTGVAKKDEFRQ